MVRSGIWSRLSEAAQAVAPVLVEFAEKEQPHHEEMTVQISYRGITRTSGVSSPNAIRKALVELSEIGFLVLPERSRLMSLERGTATYRLTPWSNALWEFAQTVARQAKQEIEAEVELRAQKRRERLRLLKGRTTT
jgi:hypothetical protein